VCGCSTVRFAYDNADAYLRWKAGSYLDLQDADAEELDDRIDEFHAWHRKNALPKYVTLANEASQRFADGLSRQDLVWGYDSVRGQAQESLRKAADLAAPLLDRLEDWVGKLTQAQIQRAREFAERAPLVDQLRDGDRRRLQKDVMAIVRAREARTRLAERIANWERGRDPAYVAALDAWREQYFAMLMDIDRSLTPEQRARAQAHMRRYAEDFEALAGR